MAKDYARHYQRSRQPKAKIGARLWVLLLPLILALGFYLYQQIIQKKSNTKKVMTPTKVAQKTLPPPKPRFEFYKMLPAMSVKVQKAEKKPVKPLSPKVVAAQETQKTTPAPVKANLAYEYMLQVASFQSINDAKRLQDQLKKKSLVVSIKNTTISDKVWYRVYVGPYHTREDAISDIITLNSLKLNPFILLIKKDQATV